ncbi:MAG: enoyl-CoA hydratase [Acidimicrobiales bacterium]|nr:enoyl-CoA hydratase [Acidimicrobiales bacterium]
MAGKYDGFSHLTFEWPEPGILRIIPYDPEKRTTSRRGVHGDLAQLWPIVDRDRDVRVAIVEFRSDTSMSPTDVEMLTEITENYEYRMDMHLEARDIVYNTLNAMTPIVATIEGQSVGAAGIVGFLADVTIAGRSAQLVDWHTAKMGVPAGDHAVLTWPLRCGLAKAKYHLMTGVPISGEEAERMGLVALCVDEKDLSKTALEVARQLSALPKDAVRWTKYALNNWLRAAGPIFDASHAIETMQLGGTPWRESAAAIREGRLPVFDAAERATLSSKE